MNSQIKQWGYNRDRHFKLSKWEKENIDLIYQRGGYFGTKIDSVYKLFKYINDKDDILKLDKTQFIGFKEELIQLINDIRKYIGNIENNDYSLRLE